MTNMTGGLVKGHMSAKCSGEKDRVPGPSIPNLTFFLSFLKIPRGSSPSSLRDRAQTKASALHPAILKE